MADTNRTIGLGRSRKAVHHRATRGTALGHRSPRAGTLLWLWGHIPKGCTFGLERDVTSLHDQARPTFWVDPGSTDGINLSLRDPTGLSATLSDMNWDFVFAREVQDFSERRYAVASYRSRNARADQICRVARKNNAYVNARLLGPSSQVKGDRRLCWV